MNKRYDIDPFEMPTEYDLIPMAGEIKGKIGNERLYILPIGGGAIRDLRRALSKSLKHVGVEFDCYKDGLQLLNPREGEPYRMVTTDPQLVAQEIERYGTKIGMLFDESAKTEEGSAVGSVIWTLENNDVFGFEELYLAIIRDYLGIGNFVASPRWESYNGLRKFLESITRKGDPWMEKISIISDYEPIQTQRDVKEQVRHFLKVMCDRG